MTTENRGRQSSRLFVTAGGPARTKHSLPSISQEAAARSEPTHQSPASASRTNGQSQTAWLAWGQTTPISSGRHSCRPDSIVASRCVPGFSSFSTAGDGLPHLRRRAEDDRSEGVPRSRSPAARRFRSDSRFRWPAEPRPIRASRQKQTRATAPFRGP